MILISLFQTIKIIYRYMSIMAKSKNKNKPTAFGEFLKEYYFKHRARKRYRKIDDACVDCKPLFKALTPEEKLP
jgi:hypothetical protein